MGISKEIENYEPTQLITLLEQSNAEMKKQTWLNFGNDDSISSKVIRTQTEQFLRARVILLVFKKIYSCLFIPNCTRNHVITYAN